MARSIEVIKQQMIEAKNGQPGLAGLNSPSQSAIWNLWMYITAVAINFHEQLWDIFRTEIEQIAANVAPGTPQWLRSKVLEFQYSSATPQTVQLINFAPRYDPVVPEFRLVTQCSVKITNNRTIVLKVAKGTTTLEPLGIPPFNLTNNTLDNNAEISALKSYIDAIKFAGTSIRVISLFSDKVQVGANIFYDGQYVKENVKDAIKTAIATYLKNLPFDGVIYNTKIVDAIQLVPGVLDVQLLYVKARTDSQGAGVATNVLRTYELEAGYAIPETVSGYTFDDTINMQPPL
jgi:hypothetical protein